MGLQSGMIEFEVDQTQLQRIELKLNDMKAKAPQALKNAVNATARDAKKDLADKAKETYAVKSPRFKKAIAQKNATASNPTATLKITGAVNELAGRYCTVLASEVSCGTFHSYHDRERSQGIWHREAEHRREPAEEHPEADRQNTGRQVNDGADFTGRTCKGNRDYF